MTKAQLAKAEKVGSGNDDAEGADEIDDIFSPLIFCFRVLSLQGGHVS
jgi:hypothetical protein